MLIRGRAGETPQAVPPPLHITPRQASTGPGTLLPSQPARKGGGGPGHGTSQGWRWTPVYLWRALDWLVTRLMTLCSVCTGWGICKGLWSGGAFGCFTRPSKGGRVGLP